MRNDQLTQFVKKYLSSEYSHLITLDNVVVEAVGDFMAELLAEAPIPYPKLDLVQEHLMEDAWDIIRKITYGSLTLEEYRLSQSFSESHKRKRIC